MLFFNDYTCQPFSLGGKEGLALSAEMIIKLIENGEEPVRSIHLGTELIIRDSTRK